MANESWREFYGNEAERYERARYGSRYGSAFRIAHRVLVESMVNDLIDQTELALDVAAGTGHLVPSMASISGQLFATDLTPEMMRVSQRIHALANVTYLQADANKLPFADETFDVVVSSRFLHLFPPEAQVGLLREMKRVCRPGGFVVVDVYNLTPRRILAPAIRFYRWVKNKRVEQDHYSTPMQAREMFETVGLEFVRGRGVGSYMLGAFLWLPIRMRSLLMRHPLMANPWFAEQWVLVGRCR